MADREEEIRAASRRGLRVERSAERDALRAYEREQRAIIREIAEAYRGRGGEALDARTRRAIAARLRRAQVETARRLADQLTTTHSFAHAQSLRGLARLVGRLEGQALDEAPRLQTLLNRPQVGRGVQRLAARQAAAAVTAQEAALVRALAEGHTVAAALRGAEQAALAEGWRMARAARTEAAYAYNAAISEGVEILEEEVPGLRARWTEHVDDSTWAPLDDKVAADSIALHGQVRGEHGSFIMPNDGPADLVGKTYDHPPNRPNDRAVLTPWHRSWGIPAYEVRDGRKVWLTKRSTAEDREEVRPRAERPRVERPARPAPPAVSTPAPTPAPPPTPVRRGLPAADSDEFMPRMTAEQIRRHLGVDEQRAETLANAIARERTRLKAHEAVTENVREYAARRRLGRDEQFREMFAGIADKIAPTRDVGPFHRTLEAERERLSEVLTGRAMPRGWFAPIEPVIVNMYQGDTPNLQDGNHRLSAALAAGADEITVRFIVMDRQGNWVRDEIAVMPLSLLR